MCLISLQMSANTISHILEKAFVFIYYILNGSSHTLLWHIRAFISSAGLPTDVSFRPAEELIQPVQLKKKKIVRWVSSWLCISNF